MIYSKQSGTGETVVLLHGFCETHTIWEGIHESLANHYHTVSIDLPGFGLSDLAASSITISDAGQYVYEHLKHLGIDRAVIVGHSLGGYVALSIAEKHPEFLQGLGLFHSTAYADPDEKRKNREKSITFIDKYGVEPFTNSFIPTLFYDADHEAIPKLLISAAKTAKTTVLKYTEAMMNREDRTLVLKNCKHPILLIAGTDDAAVPYADSEAQSKLNKNCTFVSLKNVGHMGMIEKPVDTIDALKNFMIKCHSVQ